MKKAGPLKKPFRTTLGLCAMAVFVWSIFLNCWCGATCDETTELGSVSAAETTHGCCAPPAPVEAPADDCCDDPNGFHCCDVDVAELAPVETTILIDFTAAATIVELPDFLLSPKPELRDTYPSPPEVAFHGPPNYLRFEILLI